MEAETLMWIALVAATPFSMWLLWQYFKWEDENKSKEWDMQIKKHKAILKEQLRAKGTLHKYTEEEITNHVIDELYEKRFKYDY